MLTQDTSDQIGRRNDEMTLWTAEEGREYQIDSMKTDDEELDAFLFSLGCYPGEPVTVIAHLKHNCIVSIKDGRYSIDRALAEAICV
jgi:ferrous iron transport protein A